MSDPSPQNNGDFSALGVYGNSRRIKQNFYLLIVVILISLCAGIVILTLYNNMLQAAILGAAIPLILVGVILVSKAEFDTAACFVAIIMFVLITIISTNGLGIHHVANISFPIILIVASLVVRQRTMVLLTIFSIGCVGWLVFGELLGLYTPEVLVRSVPGDFFTVTIMLFATVIMARSVVQVMYQSSLDVQRELKERKRAEQRLAYDALHDALTGLPNRTLFYDRLGQRLEHSRRHPQDLFAILYIDLDRFKVVNDSLGHAVGDRLLIETARRLNQYLRSEDTVSRLGGDEFGILLNDFQEISDVVHVAERIQEVLASTSMIENINRVTTGSIGITVYNSSYSNPQDMLRDADSAMYRAKSMGGGCYAIFAETMYANAMDLLRLEADLKRAVENQEWQVYYQPIVTAVNREIVSMEALVRWLHPQRGIVGPLEFIHVAEETGLILPIGEYVLRESCKQLKYWRESTRFDLAVSVNLSARQFQDHNLVSMIGSILAEVGLPGNCLHLEVTESIAMHDLTYSAKVLNNLSQLGIHISLDDFGSGYSSLAYLNRFPIKTLKVDRSFVEGIAENPNNKAITSAIISMSHALSMEVIAEGVETEEQMACLQSISCDKIQGYLISPPLPAEQFVQLLHTNSSLG